MVLRLTMAVDRYDRHFPFFDGTVSAPHGMEIRVLQVGQTVVLRDGEFRHERMIRDGEFDICEFSLSSYFMARDRGIDLMAIPVFPRRLFSAGLFYVRSDAGIEKPSELVGRRVGLNSFQTTLSVLARGDLASQYGVPWERIIWCVANDEKVAFQAKRGVEIRNLGAGVDFGLALQQGEIDALIHPHPPPSLFAGPSPARRLFADPAAEEAAYLDTHGYFPIMHVVAMRGSLLREFPNLALDIMEMFERAKGISESYYDDPNWSLLAGGRRYFEADRRSYGENLWRSGLQANADNLKRFACYMLDQELISRVPDFGDLFAPATLAT